MVGYQSWWSPSSSRAVWSKGSTTGKKTNAQPKHRSNRDRERALPFRDRLLTYEIIQTVVALFVVDALVATVLSTVRTVHDEERHGLSGICNGNLCRSRNYFG